ncbi:MAG: ATP-binding protein [Methylococcaceae bacterium]|nr:ATP-binding protein [Methylococcaceae bacterium]
MSQAFESLLHRVDTVLQRLEQVLPPPSKEPDWKDAIAFRWRGADRQQRLHPISHPKALNLSDIRCIERQKDSITRNTRQFLRGLPANNVLLWGSRGTGKSSLIKALLNEYAGQGLRLIEVDRQHLVELPDILELLENRPEKYILYCDDLSFEADDASYKTLKAVLEGSLSGLSGNALVYATSNRRHLLPEYQSENQQARYHEGEHLQCEIHQGDVVEEKISLSERFGLWLSFHPFTQEQYLDIVRYWLEKLDSLPQDWEGLRQLALRFALERGSRSGRVAWQFARDWAGKTALHKLET